MKSVISRHPLVSFFVLAFVLSWLAVLPLLLNHGLSPELFQILGAFAGPTLSALIVLAATEGRRAFRPFFARYVQWRAGIVWWLIVLFGPLIGVTLVASLIVGMRVLTGLIANLPLALTTYIDTLDIQSTAGSWNTTGDPTLVNLVARGYYQTSATFMGTRP